MNLLRPHPTPPKKILRGTMVLTVILCRLRGESLKTIATKYCDITAQGLMHRFDANGMNLRVLGGDDSEKRSRAARGLVARPAGHFWDEQLICKICGEPWVCRGLDCEKPAGVNL